MDQVTPAVEPVTVAANCCCPPGPRVFVVGLTVTEMVPGAEGLSVTTAAADAVPTTAHTFTVCCVAIEAGAVYNPDAETVPT